MTAVIGGQRAGGVTRPVIAAAVTGTFALGLAAFLLSYAALRDLALLAGLPSDQTWLWPLIVDGVIIEATISVVALRSAARSVRRYAWALLAVGAAISVAANITHAIVSADARVPGLIAALVASVPPLVLVAMTHLTVELIRNTTPTTTTETAPPATEPSSSVAALPPSAASSSAEASRAQRRAQAARMAEQQVPQREIARQLGVHPTTIARWLNAPDRPSKEETP